MKKLLLGIFILLLSIAFYVNDSSANPQIMNHRKGGKKVHQGKRNGVRINSCNYCHIGTGLKRIPGRKQMYRSGQKNYRKLRRIRKCAGSGCHN